MSPIPPLQASLVAVLEERLFTPAHLDGGASPEVMYPGWLVLATSCLGILAARRLASWGAISRTASWVAHSLYGAKVAMLLLPEASLVGGWQGGGLQAAVGPAGQRAHCSIPHSSSG
jgi:hypothetical protein